MGRDVRESLWKGAKALLRGSGLEVSVCAVCWKGWRLAAGVILCRVLLKGGRMEEGGLSWKVEQMRQVGSYCVLWLTQNQRDIV